MHTMGNTFLEIPAEGCYKMASELEEENEIGPNVTCFAPEARAPAEERQRRCF